MKPESFRWLAAAGAGAAALAVAAALVGCQAPWIRDKNKKGAEDYAVPTDDLEPEFDFVGDLTRAYGLGYTKIEAIALATRLRGTGGDPMQDIDRRATLREEMKTNGVANPDAILALDSTAMVFVRAYLPPGAQKGEPCDVIVTAPKSAKATSLRDGWLMKTRLRPVEILGDLLRQGKVLGLAQGPIVVDATFLGEDDSMNLLRGRVLGGGRSLVDRQIGLVVIGENHSMMTSTYVANAVNRRFYAYDRSKKIGAAEPKDDDYIELRINPTYKHNLGRYLRVVQSIVMHETPSQRVERLGRLEGLLLEPISAARAALRLEAIGSEAIPVLEKGLRSPDPEVRFYAAEALAYVDDSDDGPASEAMATLVDAARNSRAFRWHALTALSVIKHASAYEALTQLLHAPGVETRCGALRALQTRSPNDPLTRGQWLSEPGVETPSVRLVVVPSTQEPLVHFLRYREPQAAIFGHDVRLQSPFSLFAGKEIIVKSLDEGRVRITRFPPGEDERRLECSHRLEDVVRAIVAVGGGYGDVFQAVKEAQKSGALAARVEVSALPTADRKYDRSEAASDFDGGELSASSPLPELFSDRGDESEARDDDGAWLPSDDEDQEELPGVWRRLMRWVNPW